MTSATSFSTLSTNTDFIEVDMWRVDNVLPDDENPPIYPYAGLADSEEEENENIWILPPLPPDFLTQRSG